MRRWLNRYRFLEKEIQAREKHIQEFIVDMYNPLMANPISDMPKGKGLVSDLTYSTVERIEQQYSRMLVEMQNSVDVLVTAKHAIEDAINSLDEYERCVLYHRFMLGIHWESLPAYINYERAQCQNIEIRALDKLIGK